MLVHGRQRTLPLPIVCPVIVDELTGRERDVLRLAADWYTTPEIAETLGISVNTVKTHLRASFWKLGVHNRRDAVRTARENGLLPGPLWHRCCACNGTGRIPALETVMMP